MGGNHCPQAQGKHAHTPTIDHGMPHVQGLFERLPAPASNQSMKTMTARTVGAGVACKKARRGYNKRHPEWRLPASRRSDSQAISSTLVAIRFIKP
jgi:hypothetical protein